MKLMLIRHGLTDTNVSNLTHKTGDEVGLNKTGKDQIIKTASAIKKYSPNKIYCSPEKRSVQSAKIISKDLGIDFEIADDLRERNWGDWEGKLWSEIEAVLDHMR